MTADLDAELLEVLACPCPHHAPVDPVTDGGGSVQALRCRRCQSQFPVRDGIPVLLLDEAMPGPRGVGGEP
jgi:uncharacterized protein YbaR (Trm112 family)